MRLTARENRRKLDVLALDASVIGNRVYRPWIVADKSLSCYRVLMTLTYYLAYFRVHFRQNLGRVTNEKKFKIASRLFNFSRENPPLKG